MYTLVPTHAVIPISYCILTVSSTIAATTTPTTPTTPPADKTSKYKLIS